MSSNLDGCSVIIPDVENSHKTFDPILVGLRGKPTQQNPDHVTTEYVDIPRDFLAFHSYVTPIADVMFVNNIPFFNYHVSWYQICDC